jgi:LysR family carnitine catabolism transcriptional activator
MVASLPTFASHILPKVISVFARSHPLVGIQVYDEIQSSLVRRVQNQEAEFGIGARPDSLDGLRFAPIFSDPLVAVLPKDHPLASRSMLDLKTLAKTPLVTLSASAHIRTVIDRAFEGIGVAGRDHPPAAGAGHHRKQCFARGAAHQASRGSGIRCD